MRARPAAHGSQRFLPAPLATSLAHGCAFAGGWALLALAALAWVGLLSAALTGLGGIIAAAMLQSLGLASAIVLLAPTLIGFELARMGAAQGWRTRLGLFAAATVALSGALSAAPGLYGWPLAYGPGGMVGESVLGLGAILFAPLGSDRAELLAALAFLAPGGLAAARALRLDANPFKALARGLLSRRGWAVSDWARRPLRRDARLRGRAARIEPGLPFPVRPARNASERPEDNQVAALGSEPPETEPDARLAEESRAIARRFAPPSAGKAIEPRPRTGSPAAPARGRPPVRSTEDIAHRAAEAEMARRLERALAGLGVSGVVRAATRGPTVTLFEFAPARPPSLSRVNSLGVHLARALDSPPLRVSILPGDAIGFEVANARRDPVEMSDMVERAAARSRETRLPVAVGKAIGGEGIVADLVRMPHLLIAGGPGSGKSMGLHAIALSLIRAQSPERCRLLLMDGKAVELSIYNGCPHLLAPVVTGPGAAASALAWIVAEADRRSLVMAKFAASGVEALNARVRVASARGEALARAVETGFDARTGKAIVERERLPLEPMPYIVVIIDELADLLTGPGRAIGRTLVRLARSGPAVGVHLVVATQRPSADVIPGAFKAAAPARMAYRAASRLESRLILNEAGAEQLLGAGDLLLSSGAGQSVRLQGPFAARDEIAALAGLSRLGP